MKISKDKFLLFLFCSLFTFFINNKDLIAITQPDFKLPLPAGKSWFLSVETGTATKVCNKEDNRDIVGVNCCNGGIGGIFYAGGYDCYHSGRGKYSLDFLDNYKDEKGNLIDGQDVEILK